MQSSGVFAPRGRRVVPLGCHCEARLRRSNPESLRGKILDCYGAKAPRNDGGSCLIC